MFQTRFVEKIKINILRSKTFSENRAVYELMWNVYGRARQATDDNIIRRMRFACRINKTRIQTHTQYISYLLLSHGKNGYANAPQYYVIRHCLFCLNFI
jgi:hypothetical protein